MRNPFNPRNIIRVYNATTSTSYNCYVVFSTKDEKVRKWEILGYEKLVKKDELKRTMIFQFQEKEDCIKFKRWLYKKIWGIDI